MRQAIVPYMPLISALLGVAVGFIRKWTPSTGKWHTPEGHAILVAAGFVLGGVASWVQQGDLHVASLIPALTTAVTAWATALKLMGQVTPNEPAKPPAVPIEKVG